jgi:hypothetical protein
MKPARSVPRAEDRFPIEITALGLGNSCVAAIGTSDSRANSIATLRKIQSVARRATHAIIGSPANERCIDTTLQDKVFNKAAYGIFGERGCHGGAQSKTTTKAAGYVILAAAFPGGELSGRMDTAFARIKAQHHFT